ncbi:AIR synthase family protein, partial [bacterium]|nr:AIR synthase family protein [bacterium]
LGSLGGDPSVVVGPGIGRDVAVIDVGAPELLLLKSDPITFATDEIGFYAVTVNVNDIATAGGTPRWFLATVLLPEKDATADSVSSLLTQVRSACDHYGMSLVGGHTEVTLGLDRPVISGTVVGQVARDRLVTNSGIRPGDALLVTKAVPLEGTSLLARELRPRLLEEGFAPEFLDACADLLHRPGIGVLAEAKLACETARVHAMHDPTEGGLATGLWEMSTAGHVGLEVDGSALPLLSEGARLCRHLGLNPLGLIASGSLLLAVAPEDAPAVIEACLRGGIDCTLLGRVTQPGGDCVLRTPEGAVPLPRFDQDELTRVFT